MLSAIVAFLTGPGGLYAVLAAAIGAALLWARRSGVKAERSKIDRERLDARSEADKIDQAIAGMTDEEVLKEQAKWSRKR